MEEILWVGEEAVDGCWCGGVRCFAALAGWLSCRDGLCGREKMLRGEMVQGGGWVVRWPVCGGLGKKKGRSKRHRSSHPKAHHGRENSNQSALSKQRHISHARAARCQGPATPRTASVMPCAAAQGLWEACLSFGLWVDSALASSPAHRAFEHTHDTTRARKARAAARTHRLPCTIVSSSSSSTTRRHISAAPIHPLNTAHPPIPFPHQQQNPSSLPPPPPKTTKMLFKTKNAQYVASVVATYWLVSISMVYLNKVLMTNTELSIPAPLFVTWFQCLFSTSLTHPPTHPIPQPLVLPTHLLSVHPPTATFLPIASPPTHPPIQTKQPRACVTYVGRWVRSSVGRGKPHTSPNSHPCATIGWWLVKSVFFLSSLWAWLPSIICA